MKKVREWGWVWGEAARGHCSREEGVREERRTGSGTGKYRTMVLSVFFDWLKESRTAAGACSSGVVAVVDFRQMQGQERKLVCAGV